MEDGVGPGAVADADNPVVHGDLDRAVAGRPGRLPSRWLAEVFVERGQVFRCGRKRCGRTGGDGRFEHLAGLLALPDWTLVRVCPRDLLQGQRVETPRGA